MKKLFTSSLFLFICASAAFASFISLETAVTSKVSGNTIEVILEATNAGDEAAYNVFAEVNLAGKRVLFRKIPELDRGAVYRASKKIRLDIERPGSYPLVVKMHYSDANQYPFSALLAQTFNYKVLEVAPELFGKLKSLAFFKKGTLAAHLKNLGGTDLQVSSRIFVPNELTADKPLHESIISKYETARINFPVENFSALNGSNYQVYCVSQYEKDGIHATQIIPGHVLITTDGPPQKVRVAAIILILLGIIIVISAYFLKKRK
ncbi:MAG: hypothetical protein HQ596_06735 [Candidatus Saganbacteria bacterium]|nr:hypothetical protein [Candidatus Saganbacteria bacterium]